MARHEQPAPTKPGYRYQEIPKGTIGTSSKILEEAFELQDAEEQGAKVMALVELSDLIGAVEHYLDTNHAGMTIDDQLVSIIVHSPRGKLIMKTSGMSTLKPRGSLSLNR